MAEHSTIEWTDATWNPITGCSVVSPGCTNCYAMRLAGTRLQHHPSRAGLTRETKAGPVWTGEVRLNEDWLEQPLHWRRPRRIFACAPGDLFHEQVPDEWIDRVFAVMGACEDADRSHTFEVLTKRSARMRHYMRERGHRAWNLHRLGAEAYPPRNVWLGVSAEDQSRADERIADLVQTAAAVRFLSCEPLLSAIRLDRWLWDVRRDDDGLKDAQPSDAIDWVIAGGESGADARPMHPNWVRDLRDQCTAAEVPFFFKQWGEWAPVCAMTDGQVNSFYRAAPERHSEAARRCKVPTCVLHGNGDRFDHRAPLAHAQGTASMMMMQIGKKGAGRLLDGREWNELP